MPGRKEKAILYHLPAYEMAKYLRGLRVEAGTPSYRTLGRLAFAAHNRLSQIASGRYVQWESVLLFLKALEEHCPGTVTPVHVGELKVLHGQAAARNQARKLASPRGASRLLWRQTDRDLREPGERAAANRAAGTWHTTDAVWISRLNALVRRRDLYTLLQQKMLADTPQDEPEADAVNAEGQPIARLIPLDSLNLEQILQVIKDLGGSDGDCLAWSAAWERTKPLTRTVPQPRPPATAESCSGEPDLSGFPIWGAHDEPAYERRYVVRLPTRRKRRP